MFFSVHLVKVNIILLQMLDGNLGVLMSDFDQTRSYYAHRAVYAARGREAFPKVSYAGSQEFATITASTSPFIPFPYKPPPPTEPRVGRNAEG